ncbi:hypothetical protein [Microcoleus sp. D3_18a_C4]
MAIALWDLTWERRSHFGKKGRSHFRKKKQLRYTQSIMRQL